MVYELVIDDGKEKPIISLLKQLDFVSVKVIRKAYRKRPHNSAGDKALPNSGAYPGWGVDAQDGQNTLNRMKDYKGPELENNI